MMGIFALVLIFVLGLTHMIAGNIFFFLCLLWTVASAMQLRIPWRRKGKHAQPPRFTDDRVGHSACEVSNSLTLMAYAEKISVPESGATDEIYEQPQTSYPLLSKPE